MNLAELAIEEMKADGVIGNFLNGTEAERIELGSIYAEAANKKFQAFVAKYQTNDAARAAFNAQVLATI
jgi:hypothetical protein